MGAVFCNAYVDTMAPWALKKSDPERMAAVLGTLVVAVRKLAATVQPVIPASAEKLIALIDNGKDGAAIASPPDLPAIRAWRTRRKQREADRQPLPPQLRRPGRAPGRSAGQCRARGIGGFPNISTARMSGMTSSARPSVIRMFGPQSAFIPMRPILTPTWAAALVEATNHPRVIAIGECGLDYYYDKSGHAAQRERFRPISRPRGRPACRW
jgi:hypothetical protein